MRALRATSDKASLGPQAAPMDVYPLSDAPVLYNEMTKEEQEREGAWARAQRDAKGLHKKRVEEGGRAPHPPRVAPTRERHVPREVIPAREVRRSRSSVGRHVPEQPVRLRSIDPEWEYVDVEPEPVRPVRRHMPPPEPPSPPRGRSGPPPRVGEGPSEDGGGKAAKQLTINITL